MRKTTIALLTLTAILLPAALQAGTATTKSERLAASVLHGDLGVNFVSEYIGRGVVAERKGVIAQPYVNLYLTMYEGNGCIQKVTLDLGLWSSVHSRRNSWFELDYSPGVSVNFAQDFLLVAHYLGVNSPANAFRTSHNLNFTLAYDDARLLGAWALNPHFTYLRELQGKVGNGPSCGNYYNVGIAPALPSCGPVTFSLPVNAGFGNAGFYRDNKTFGFFSSGVNAAVPLPCPPAFGQWALNFGATYYYLPKHQVEAERISQNRVVFMGGVGMSF